MDKPALTISLLLLTGGAASAVAQGFSPSSPTQELIYFGGRLVAIEERGPGGNNGAVTKSPTKSPRGPAAPSSVTSTGVVLPPQPNPSVPPQDTSASAGQPIYTPPSTHGTFLPQS